MRAAQERGIRAMEKLNKLKACGEAKAEHIEIIGDSTHRTMWSFAYRFEIESTTFYFCYWDVSKCRSDQYIKPLWDKEKRCVLGTMFNDDLLFLEKAKVVHQCLKNPVKMTIELIQVRSTLPTLHCHEAYLTCCVCVCSLISI
jgi:hypothetical protein